MIRRHGLFFLSCLLAFTAGHMFNYTVILYLQESVGSTLLSGLGFGLAYGSSLVFGWFAGVLCDRIAPVKVIHGAQALFLVGLAGLFWADTGGVSHRVAWTLLGAFAGGVAWSFAGPARLTTLGQIVSADELRPATIVFNLQVLLGFGLAPLAIGVTRSHAGWGTVLGIAAAGFVLASLLILGVRSRAHATPSGQSMLADVGAGFQAVGSQRLLRQLMIGAVIGYAMTGPMQILLPKLARDVLGLSEAQRGAYLGLLAISLIVGGVLALALSRRIHHGRTIFGGIVVGSLLFASLAVVRAPLLSAALLGCVGVLGGVVISLVVSGIQAQAADATRGRVMAMYSITSQVLPAFSGIAAGLLVSRLDVTWAIATAGVSLATIALVAAMRMTSLRGHSGH